MKQCNCVLPHVMEWNDDNDAGVCISCHGFVTRFVHQSRHDDWNAMVNKNRANGDDD